MLSILVVTLFMYRLEVPNYLIIECVMLNQGSQLIN
jgi:hypothetical protein